MTHCWARLCHTRSRPRSCQEVLRPASLDGTYARGPHAPRSDQLPQNRASCKCSLIEGLAKVQPVVISFLVESVPAACYQILMFAQLAVFYLAWASSVHGCC